MEVCRKGVGSLGSACLSSLRLASDVTDRHKEGRLL